MRHIYRSYFSKNNTIVKENLINSSQNPVTEITYGTNDKLLSRFIFDIDLIPLVNEIKKGNILFDNLSKHVLNITNTIAGRDYFHNEPTYDSMLERASSFTLDLFNINQSWDEGSGYDVVFGHHIILDETDNKGSNWKYRKNNVEWEEKGIYISGQTETIKTINFEKGNENILVDVTDYVNNRISELLNNNEQSSYGLGLKFSDEFENKKTNLRQVVGFHTKQTHTFYKPYIQTTINDHVFDDREYFYNDRNNKIYLYLSDVSDGDNVEFENVKVYDHNSDLYKTYENQSITGHTGQTGNTINQISKNLYYIETNVNSDQYPDAVIFTDEWNLKINGRKIQHRDGFYIKSSENKYFKDIIHSSPNNYFFNVVGFNENEHITKGSKRLIKFTLKELYPDYYNKKDHQIYYRIYTTIDKPNQIDVIPKQKINRLKNDYYVYLDTSWFVSQDYLMDVFIYSGGMNVHKQTHKFTVVDW